VEEHVSVRTEEDTKMHEKETLDEKLPALFEPDTLLPIQYFEAMRRKHLLEGEKRLVLSVLEDAVECFMKLIDSPTSKGQRLFREAEEWINHEDKKWVFSFDNVCDMLDINPQYMRRGLRAWKQRKIEELARRAVEGTQDAAPEKPAELPQQPPEPIAETKPEKHPAKVAAPARSARHKRAAVSKDRRRAGLRKARA
jgi:hypothetical protein